MTAQEKAKLLRRFYDGYWRSIISDSDPVQNAATKLGLSAAALLGDVLDRLDFLEKKNIELGIKGAEQKPDACDADSNGASA